MQLVVVAESEYEKFLEYVFLMIWIGIRAAKHMCLDESITMILLSSG